MGLLYKVRRKIWNFFFDNNNSLFKPYKGLKKVDLLIFDDIFPHPISGFRVEEFSVLLNEFKNSRILMIPDSYQTLNTPMIQHQKDIKDFLDLFPTLNRKLKLRNGAININAKLFYCVFLQNIYKNLDWLEKHRIPFAFTLYPGGGFQIGDFEIDKKLKKVFLSPQFKKVIVTQLYTRDYLLNNNLCTIENIEYIFGCVVPQISILQSNIEKTFYLKERKTLDICFCAAKYMSKGLDKGYDVFIEAAISMVSKYDFIHIHVIGGFNKDEIDVTLLEDKITFYGYQKFDDLAAIYKNMDIIISPNRPFCLGKGFDGFPLGTVIEAVFNGVVAMVSDELKQNSYFENHKDIIIIENSVESIEKEIVNLINSPDKLYSLSRNGREKFIEVYSNDFQMRPRIDILKKLL